MNVINVIKWLRVTPIPLTEISKSTGISRNTLHLWINGSTPREKNVVRVYEQYSNYINHEKFKLENIKVRKNRMSLDSNESIIDGQEIDSRYIINLQKNAIDTLNTEITQLKEALNKKQAESTHWDALPYDFISDVTLKREGLSFGRTVDSISDLNRLSEALGYSVSELENLWAIGTFYKFKDHPIDKIVAKETLKEIEKQMTTLPYVFDSIKSMVGDHYIPQPLVYIHKNGKHIGAIAYAKVQWRTLKVTAKVQFLFHMPSD